MSNALTFREGDNGAAVVDVHGELTMGETSAALRNLLQELADAGYRNIILNLAGLAENDRAAIGSFGSKDILCTLPSEAYVG